MAKVSQQSQRQLRVGEQVRHIIAQTLQMENFYNESLSNASLITVTEVRVSPDLKQATAYVVTLGNHDMTGIVAALNETAPLFQKEVAKVLQTRYTPRIHFTNDSSFAHGSRIDDILQRINTDKRDRN